MDTHRRYGGAPIRRSQYQPGPIPVAPLPNQDIADFAGTPSALGRAGPSITDLIGGSGQEGGFKQILLKLLPMILSGGLGAAFGGKAGAGSALSTYGKFDEQGRERKFRGEERAMDRELLKRQLETRETGLGARLGAQIGSAENLQVGLLDTQKILREMANKGQMNVATLVDLGATKRQAQDFLENVKQRTFQEGESEKDRRANWDIAKQHTDTAEAIANIRKAQNLTSAQLRVASYDKKTLIDSITNILGQFYAPQEMKAAAGRMLGMLIPGLNMGNAANIVKTGSRFTGQGLGGGDIDFTQEVDIGGKPPYFQQMKFYNPETGRLEPPPPGY